MAACQVRPCLWPNTWQTYSKKNYHMQVWCVLCCCFICLAGIFFINIWDVQLYDLINLIIWAKTRKGLFLVTCILMLCVVVTLSLDAGDNFSTMSVTVSDGPCQETTHPDNLLTSSYVIPGFKQFSIRLVCSLGDQCKVILLCSPKLQTCKV